MLSRSQQIMLKRAQQLAALPDDEYREAIATVSGLPDCRSSTDKRLTDGMLDNLMSYFEAIYWGKVEAAQLQHRCNPAAIFRKKGYWAQRNRRDCNSRDRYNQTAVMREIGGLQAALTDRHGCSLQYFSAIENNINPFDLQKYAAALRRTLAAKDRKSS